MRDRFNDAMANVHTAVAHRGLRVVGEIGEISAVVGLGTALASGNVMQGVAAAALTNSVIAPTVAAASLFGQRVKARRASAQEVSAPETELE